MKNHFKILVTDDDSDLRELLTEAIRNWGYGVDVAKDGQEALDKLKDGYDIVISDLMMPGMDGIALLRKIREADPEVLVIIITGYASIETAVKAIELGAYDYIAKPFRLDELMIVVRNAMEKLSMARENARLSVELRAAIAEIAELKRAISEGAVTPGAAHDEDYMRGIRAEGVEQVKAHKLNEYVREADRPIVGKPQKT